MAQEETKKNNYYYRFLFQNFHRFHFKVQYNIISQSITIVTTWCHKKKNKIVVVMESKINPLTRADILARAQIQTWKIPFKTKY